MLRNLCLAIALVSIPAAGLAFRAINRLEIVPVSGGVFEVVGRVGSSARDFWCGAGDYTIAQLRASSAQRIFMWSEIGPSQTRPGKNAIRFALTEPPGGAVDPGFTLSMRRVGDNMRASHAQGYCKAPVIPHF